MATLAPATASAAAPTKPDAAAAAVGALKAALAPGGVDVVEPLAWGWLVDALTAADPAAAAALPAHPPSTLTIFTAASRAAWAALVAARVDAASDAAASDAAASDAAASDDDDPLAAHLTRTLDAAAAAAGGVVAWRPAAAPGAPAPVAAAAATAAGWAPGAGAVPRLCPRYGPWVEAVGLVAFPGVTCRAPRPAPRPPALTAPAACYAALAAAAATAAAGTPGEWRAAAEARDAAGPGNPWRYCDALLRYLHGGGAADRAAALAAAVAGAASAAAAAAAAAQVRPGTPPRATLDAPARGSSPDSP